MTGDADENATTANCRSDCWAVVVAVAVVAVGAGFAAVAVVVEVPVAVAGQLSGELA